MLNHVTLMGRLTRDPELKQVGQGNTVANFSLAVNRDFKNKQTGDFEADFFDIRAWRHTAEFVGKYFAKGQLVAVEGRLQAETYTDKEGVKRKAVRVVASQVHFAEKRDSTPQQAPQYTPPSPQGYVQPTNYAVPPYNPEQP